MKRLVRLSASTALAASLLCLPLSAAETPAGFVDFGKFSPPGDGSQFVEVNVGAGLLTIATKIVEKSEPDVADLLRDLVSVRVNVIGVTDANRADLSSRISQIRQDLEGKGWERVVTVQENKQDVGVYLKHRGTEAIEGAVVTVVDEKGEAVFVNVVGNIRPEKIALLGEKLNIEPLKKAGDAIKER